MNYYLQENWLNIKVETIPFNTIQDFFDVYIPSKKIQHLLIQNKHILLDGKNCKRETEIKGNTLSINIYPTLREKKEIIDIKLNILYQDEFILIVDKPKNMLVHDDGNNQITLTDILQSQLDTKYELLPIHRLDYLTDGLVIYSKSPIFHPYLDKLLLEKQINRIYIAYVLGHMDEKKGFSISKPIGKDRHTNGKMIVSKYGDKAITKIKCLKSYSTHSIIECSLLTGRTHQIRVHLSSIGYPIINDPLYGKESNIIQGMGLSAYKIEMNKLLTDQKISIKKKWD